METEKAANAERFHEIARRIRESSSKYVAVAILEAFVGEVLAEHDDQRLRTLANLVSGLKPRDVTWESNQGRDEYHCERCGDSYTPCKHWVK